MVFKKKTALPLKGSSEIRNVRSCLPCVLEVLEVYHELLHINCSIFNKGVLSLKSVLDIGLYMIKRL